MSVRVRAPLEGAEAARLARGVLRADRVRRAMLSIALVGRRRIRSLNRRHLGRNRDTDVIAFALTAPPGPRTRGRQVIGDVYVCVPVAAAQAARYGCTPRDELSRLVVHGVLHVLGYEHPVGRARTASMMWRRQERLLRSLVRAR